MENANVNILVVDDRPDRVLALEAVLQDLGSNIVAAYSGREALRALLNQEFAVVLLDINMPGMDGFETASLVRARDATRDLPIIFVTAYGDEMQVARSYSLGAVDFIQTPIVPEILRTKVQVFVDLHKKRAEVQQQATWLQQRATQLHKLTAASLVINSALSLEKLVQVATDAARDVIGTHLALTSVLPSIDCNKLTFACSVSDKYSPCEPEDLDATLAQLRALLCRTNKPLRLTREDLDQNVAETGALRVRANARLSGYLAAPLTGRDSRNLGFIELSDRHSGEFSAADEALLVQLAQMVSIAIENTLFAEAREANRLKDEFIWVLSHELRTPLNAILGWTQLLNRQQNLPKEIAYAIEVIDRNARAQTRLVDEMLDLSRIATGKLQLNLRSTDLAPIVQAAVEAVMPAAAGKRITLESELSNVPVNLLADPDRLQQVIWNLLTNAVKFTPTGGRIHIALELLDAHVIVRVSDNGQGITPLFLPHVFEPFRQSDGSTTRSQTGLGIGLSIVRHLVELHGGTVQAASPGPGQGATFTVTLPTRLAAPLTPATAPEPIIEAPADVRLGGVHVLLVDDEPDAREVISALLTDMHAEVTTAASAAEALECLKVRRPDILLSDIAMPEQDGYQLLQAFRKLAEANGATVPAIALTAYASQVDRARILAAGFQGHVSKPVDPVVLATSIQRLVRSTNVVSEIEPVVVSSK